MGTNIYCSAFFLQTNLDKNANRFQTPFGVLFLLYHSFELIQDYVSGFDMKFFIQTKLNKEVNKFNMHNI